MLEMVPAGLITCVGCGLGGTAGGWATTPACCCPAGKQKSWVKKMDRYFAKRMS